MRTRRRMLIGGACAATILITLFAWDRIMLGNVPIDFHGRVVDESGAGISGVSVRLVVSRNRIHHIPVLNAQSRRSTERFSLVTDEEGYFRASASRGISVNIESIEKDGWRPLGGTPGSFGYSNPRFPLPSSRESAAIYRLAPNIAPDVTGNNHLGE